MRIFDYNDKENQRQEHCERCGKWYGEDRLHPHHIHLKKNSDDCVWVCFKCHRWIHDHVSEAENEGFLIRSTFGMKLNKAKKTKSCEHSKTWNKFDATGLHIMCSYCGKEVKEAKFGTHKKKTNPTETNKVPKMGYGQSDPRIVEAENLKRQLTSLKLKAKQSAGDAEEWKRIKDQEKEVKAKMKKLQDSYED